MYFKIQIQHAIQQHYHHFPRKRTDKLVILTLSLRQGLINDPLASQRSAAMETCLLQNEDIESL